MFLKSKFKLWAFLPIGLLIVLTCLLAFFLTELVDNKSFPIFGVFVFIGFFVFVWVWLFFGELRTKVIKVEIWENEIALSRYLGLGKKVIYKFDEIEGFETSLLPSKYDTYEFLYLIANNKKLIKLSEYYHSNYPDLKRILSSKVNDLGQKKFSYLNELKEIFI